MAQGRGVCGSGSHCCKRPVFGSTVYPRAARASLALDLRGTLARCFTRGFSFLRDCALISTSQTRSGIFAHPSRGGATSPAHSLRSPPLYSIAKDRLAGSCAVLRCPLTCAVNGQQHSSSCFVCNSQYHGLVQGGAPAPAISGLARARPLPLPPGHSASPL